jgi:hypothetical protein
MKKQILILGFALATFGLILITSSIVNAQTAASPAGNEFTIPLTDPAKRGKLKAHINSGSITIKGTARKDVLVRYTGEEDDDNNHHNHNGNNNKDREGLRKVGGGGLDLEASENNNFVKVQSGSWNNKIDLVIEIPSGFDLDVHTYNDGDLMITNVQGAVELEDYNGDISALNISGSVVATSYNGEIKVTFDKVTENTPMSYTSYNGDIDLSFPSATKATFKMKTDQGEIYTGFDMTVSKSEPQQKKDARSGTFKIVIDDWRKGDINGGGPEIVMKTYNGNLYVRKK